MLQASFKGIGALPQQAIGLLWHKDTACIVVFLRFLTPFVCSWVVRLLSSYVSKLFEKKILINKYWITLKVSVSDGHRDLFLLAICRNIRVAWPGAAGRSGLERRDSRSAGAPEKHLPVTQRDSCDKTACAQGVVGHATRILRQPRPARLEP